MKHRKKKRLKKSEQCTVTYETVSSSLTYINEAPREGDRGGIKFLSPWSRVRGEIFFSVDMQLFRHHLLKRLNYLDTFAENQLTVWMWVYFWALQLTSFCVCPHARPTAIITTVLCRLWNQIVKPLQLCFQNCSSYSRSFVFVYKF